MAKKGFGFTEDYLKQSGYTKDTDGSWIPPKGKNKLISEKKAISEDLIERKTIPTPNFTADVKTEWKITYNVPAKKNSRRNFVKNGKQISIPSKAHAEYEKLTKMQYDIFGREFRKAVEKFGLSYPLQVEFTFIRNSKHRFDYSNILQTVEDLMKEDKRWIDDDSADHLFPIFKPYKYDKHNPGVIIKLIV